MGILMIIFASLGLIGSLIGLAGSGVNKAASEGIPALKTWATLSLVFGVVGLGVSALHLFAGVRAVGYKANAPKLAVTYAMLNILNNLVQLIMIFAWLKPAISKVGGREAEAVASLVGGFAVFGVILAIIWPTLVMILMTRPAAKAACTN
jgi:hypothetical protein